MEISPLFVKHCFHLLPHEKTDGWSQEKHLLLAWSLFHWAAHKTKSIILAPLVASHLFLIVQGHQTVTPDKSRIWINGRSSSSRCCCCCWYSVIIDMWLSSGSPSNPHSKFSRARTLEVNLSFRYHALKVKNQVNRSVCPILNYLDCMPGSLIMGFRTNTEVVPSRYPK